MEVIEQAIAVVGVGNPLLSDDGVGIHTIRMLRSRPMPPVARLIDGGTIGSDLLAEVSGCEKLLIIDSVDAGLRPGSIVWLDLSAAEALPVQARNAHQFGIRGLLDDLRLLGCEPKETLLVGIQPATIGWGTGLSDEVANALPPLADDVVRQIVLWTGPSPRLPRKDQGTLGTRTWRAGVRKREG